ncbi:3,4-dihydroxy-2-butanone-4-phosphate synthase [Frigoribacterium sp. CFBP9039]|uniref:3,4-dihydroxy-2-butanone-4-phosphate synthase n=1 Tax=Frigoribacterium TaxID=96492 RepID=UPI001783474E|nr:MULTISPECIES: 3,4-dihydroxy-2-butanone-4-phosphate synthase [Frigoribacterium]MBD8704941.1 3,4-dihydroxy-2-butanone-4-phosphate synthase [Frigoribacterium sp. CFBP 13712]MCJ0700361.1 3,4-dihydroxy-2-butanone-4-phosphate synthase [Frigoribacterium faeni]MDY0947171.1 3,4-dihydroxy-2-butanone-4-phosphate synthase [Frigoribacterium sp. CFBP9039]
MTLQTETPDAPPAAIGAAPLSDARAAIDAIGRGEMVVVVDDEDRENEGDLIVAAEHVTPQIVNFMITHGRGLVCLALDEGRAAELRLDPMVEKNEDHQSTAFTVSIDGTPAHGVTTGISASERATTIHLAVSGDANDLARPGHVFPLIARPGGVLERPGHTEASVDLARLAGCAPAGVIVEIIGVDGEMLRLDALREFAAEHGLVLTSIAELVRHRADEARTEQGRD